MNDRENPINVIQDQAAYLSGAHDFQADIDLLANSDLIKTVLETIMQATGVRFAAVARVTDQRWVACRTVDEVNFGLNAGDEIEIESTFCQSVRDTGDRVVFDDVGSDDVYCGHPIATKFGIVSYASIPIYRRDGSFFGTLCAIDTEPRKLKNPRTMAMLDMFTEVVSKCLENEEKLVSRQLLIEKERAMAQLQQEFIAILGHDLRNPVAAIEAGIRQLSKDDLTERSHRIVNLLRMSVLRVNELVDNMMMHAKLRLGTGFQIERKLNAPLQEQLTHIVEEHRIAVPNTQIDLDLSIDRPVNCDASRIAQAISNLLSNAISHGDEKAPIRIAGKMSNGLMLITVSNEGEAIPLDVQKNLFVPYVRGQETKKDGLGLGLFIARSIANAHGGDIELMCVNNITTFKLYFPVEEVQAKIVHDGHDQPAHSLA